jgi:hypothetical protein
MTKYTTRSIYPQDAFCIHPINFRDHPKALKVRPKLAERLIRQHQIDQDKLIGRYHRALAARVRS